MKITSKVLVLLVCLLLVTAPHALAQDLCVGDFDYDGDCDGSDAARFKLDFGRSMFENPCPPDGPAPVPKTGQTTSFATGDDGDLEKGVPWPNPRFADNLDGTVTDNLTGLIWLKDANCFGNRLWNDALSDCNGLSSGFCELTDGSSTGDWRLPSLFELESLRDMNSSDPALPFGHPFTNVQQSLYYWSSTTYEDYFYNAWFMYLYNGNVGSDYKSSIGFVWPVRNGH
jgi:hypothetical protein